MAVYSLGKGMTEEWRRCKQLGPMDDQASLNEQSYLTLILLFNLHKFKMWQSRFPVPPTFAHTTAENVRTSIKYLSWSIDIMPLPVHYKGILSEVHTMHQGLNARQWSAIYMYTSKACLQYCYFRCYNSLKCCS